MTSPAHARRAPEPPQNPQEYAQPADQRKRGPQNLRAISAESAETHARTALTATTPVDLGTPTGLPAFPVHALPDVIADMVTAVAESKQVDVGMPAVMTLGVLAATTCGRVQVLPRPGWTEEANLFVLVCADPSERKGPVERELRRPLDEATAELIGQAAVAQREAELTRQVASDVATAAVNRAAKLDDPGKRDQALAEALDLDAAARAIDVPPVPKLVAGGDITPEALAEVMHRHGGRITILDTEGGFFDRLAGLYSNGIKNLDAVLHGYSGEPVEVNRRSGAELIPRAGLSLALMVQPVVVDKLTSDPEMAGRGLLARFLYANPPSLVGRRRTGRHVPPVPAEIAAAYTARIGGLATELAAWTDPAQLHFTYDALDVLDPFEAAIEARQAPGADLAVTGPWAGKFVGNVIRLAGLLHLADHGPAGLRAAIGPEHTTAAIQIGDYFTAHAHTALAPRRAAVDDARYLLTHLQRRQLTEFTTRDLLTGLSRDRFPTKDTVLDALDILTQHGWITPLPVPTPTGPGRKPSPHHLVHPALWSQQ